MIRTILIRVFSVGIGLIFAVVFAEVILRIFQLAPTGGVATVTESDFATIPGIYMPNQRLVDVRSPALPHHVSINSLGYRGEEFPQYKPDRELRILMVGDSFTYGDFVDNVASLPAQLEREIRIRCHQVRVINAGVGGTTIVTHAKMVERALPLTPDLVILVFSENDVINLNTPMWHSLAENRRRKSRSPLSIVYPIFRHLALWHFSLSLKARFLATNPAANKPPMDSQIHIDTPLHRQYREELLALRDRLNNQDIPFVFTTYPSHYTIHLAKPSGLVRWAISTAEKASIPTFNLWQPLHKSGLSAETLYLLPHDGHPSEQGYRVAAEFLAANLNQVRGGQISYC